MSSNFMPTHALFLPHPSHIKSPFSFGIALEQGYWFVVFLAHNLIPKWIYVGECGNYITSMDETNLTLYKYKLLCEKDEKSY